ncbi:DUF262 domain-containing protein [Acidisoma sp. S159]|uniref:DUF262 domain-containing protein n=1 Tax=Acidisoma sp. S159 TaxID=1747225 RepID=UPI00131D8D2E|nr:DUF262 domain-containing protein [Acidisoma sp. S159]
MFQIPITIANAISQIGARDLLIPAIQRKFVWTHSKVEWLFDSLLQGYPIGSFLFWEVDDPVTKTDYKFYEFLQSYRQDFKDENPHFATIGHRKFNAVLDGQQRLTALYIGLTGTYAYYRGRVNRVDNEYAYPTRRLYLNVVGKPEDSDEQTGRVYEFKFLTDVEFQSSPAKWFLVSRILKSRDLSTFTKMIISESYQLNEFATEALSQLHSVVHLEQLINYYQIEKSDMERALNVFVRVNSAEPLTLSDMLMSTAVAHWRTRDARREIPSLVNAIRERGFFVDKDFVLKACLYLYSPDIRYRVSNFTAERVRPFEDNWDAIQESVIAAFDLVRDYGYNDLTLTSKNTLLPLIYWLHHKHIASDFTSAVATRGERDLIKKWLHTMLLKSVVGSGSADSVLGAIRRVLAGEAFGVSYLRPELQSFPQVEIASSLRLQGRDPDVTAEFIESLLLTQKDNRQAFPILALLSPHLDYKNGNFHADHLHPASAFRQKDLARSEVLGEDVEFYADYRHWNSILNLSHLDANENMSKQATSLSVWAAAEAEHQKISHAKFCVDHILPEEPDLAFGRFRVFIEARRRILSQKLREALQ